MIPPGWLAIRQAIERLRGRATVAEEFRECPACRGIRRPCGRCQGHRIVPGRPADAAEAGRVAIALRMLGPPPPDRGTFRR